jgi:hypothetical protein
VLSCHRSREESKDRLRSRPEWSETERRYSVGEREALACLWYARDGTCM